MYRPRMPGEEGGGNFVPVNPNYYIDPVNGDDNANGFTPQTALKTYAELQERFGRFTTIFIPPPEDRNPPGPPDPPFNQINITNMTAGAGGQILLTLANPPAGVVTGSQVEVTAFFLTFAGTIGTHESIGIWTVKVVSPTELLLEGSHFVNAYTGGAVLYTPIVKQINIFLLGDLPVNDPITFYNFIGANNSVVIIGTQTVLHTGTITAEQTEDIFTNTPWTITDPTVPDWSSFLFQTQVQFLTGALGPFYPEDVFGARAYPVIDKGGGTVQLSELLYASQTGNFPVPNFSPGLTGLASFFGSPAPGDEYRVVKFSSAVLGPCLAGNDSSAAESQTRPGQSGVFALQYLTLISPPATTPAPQFPGPVILDGIIPLTSTTTMIYCDVIFNGPPDEGPNITFTGNLTFLVNPCFNNAFVTFLGQANSDGCSWAFGAVQGSFATSFEGGSFMYVDSVTSVGNNGTGPDSTFSIGGFGVGGGANISAGPLAFWNMDGVNFAMFPQSSISFHSQSPFTSAMGYPALWGDSSFTGNSTNTFREHTSMHIVQVVAATADLLPPLLKSGFADALMGPILDGAIVSGSPTEAYAFDPATGASVAGLRAFTWASLLTPVGGGGYQQAHQSTGGAGYDAVGGAYRPDSFSSIIFDAVVFPGP
jgi:hypothetical protein